jgi:hypothetical protein
MLYQRSRRAAVPSSSDSRRLATCGGQIAASLVNNQSRMAALSCRRRSRRATGGRAQPPACRGKQLRPAAAPAGNDPPRSALRGALALLLGQCPSLWLTFPSRVGAATGRATPPHATSRITVGTPSAHPPGLGRQCPEIRPCLCPPVSNRPCPSGHCPANLGAVENIRALASKPRQLSHSRPYWTVGHHFRGKSAFGAAFSNPSGDRIAPLAPCPIGRRRPVGPPVRAATD